MTAEHPCAARAARRTSESYALSANRQRGAAFSSNPWAGWRSCRWPSVISKVSGKPRASTTRWTFVQSPPRERPMPWAAPPLGPGGMLMRTIDRAVEAVPFVVAVRLQRQEQTIPFSGLGPAIKPVEDGLPWTELRREVAPRHAGAAPPQHRFEEAAIIVAWPTRSAFRAQ